MKPPSASARGKQSALRPARTDPAELRRQHLYSQFASTVEALQRCRADLIPEGVIAEFVALDWLEWNGGAVRLTTTGSNVCKQMQVRPA